MKSRFLKLSAIFMAAFMLICMLPVNMIAADGGEEIPIDAAHFPDDNFRNFIATGQDGRTGVNIDTDGNGSLSASEIAAVESIDVCYRNIADLTGIGYFTELTDLDCSDNQLTSLNIESNTLLTGLNCSFNGLTSLNLSNNADLIMLYCSGNDLTSLDLSNNTTLSHLECNSNQLTSLNVSNNTALARLECISNELTSLNVSNNTEIWWLDCSGNELTTLNLSNNAALEQLWCYGNRLTTLNVSNNTNLWWFECYGNRLTDLDLSNNTDLTVLYCYDNELTSLDLSNNTYLEYLYYGSNPLTDPYQPLETLTPKTAAGLRGLQCNDLGLTEIDLTPYTALTTLSCNKNLLTSLDVSNNTALGNLDCSGNRLTSLDISNNTALTMLYCSRNLLTSLDVSNNTILRELLCDLNSYPVFSSPYDLTGLPEGFDLSKTSNWQNGTVEGNILTFIDENEPVKYTYDCGNGHKAVFSLYISDVLPGDYDCSETVDITDALLTLRAAMNLLTPSEQALANADIDGDSVLTVSDAVQVMRIALGV